MSQLESPPEAAVATLRPLCVDLDGSLVKSDTLIDSFLVLVRTHPALLFALPGRLVHGKAALKAFITAHISLDVAHLPYNRKLVQFLHEEKARGRAIYLVTGADAGLAQRVAAHFGIFTGVLASDGQVNLTGTRKLDRLRGQLARARRVSPRSTTSAMTLPICRCWPRPPNPWWPIRAFACA